MGKPNLVPYETIVRVTSGESEAVDEVLQHYSRHKHHTIRILISIMVQGCDAGLFAAYRMFRDRFRISRSVEVW